MHPVPCDAPRCADCGLPPQSKSDPFCCVRVEGHQRNTTVVKKNMFPEWNEYFGFKVLDRTRAIFELFLYDMDRNHSTDPMVGAAHAGFVCSCPCRACACAAR